MGLKAQGMPPEMKRLIQKQKRGIVLTVEERTYFDTTKTAISLWLLSAQAQKSLRVPYPVVVIPREKVLSWCLVPTPTIEVQRIRTERRKGELRIHHHHTLERRLSPKARRAWAAMCRRQAEIEARITEGHPISENERLFARCAGLAQEWAKWGRAFGHRKPAIPPVIVVRREEAPAWVLLPAGDPR